MASGSAGRLRIGFVGAMLYRGLPQALRAFQAKHPVVRVTLSELNSGVQIAELLNDRLDLGFAHTHRVPPELQHRLLLSESFVCCLPSGHVLARKRVLAPADLRDQPFVLFSREASPDYHETSASCRSAPTQAFCPRCGTRCATGSRSSCWCRRAWVWRWCRRRCGIRLCAVRCSARSTGRWCSRRLMASGARGRPTC